MSDKVRPPPVEPVLAATILILRDDPFEVLMVRRRSSSFFSSALVFPGGVVDPEDTSEDWLAHVTGAEALSAEQRAARIGACREAYEEASVLLTPGAAQTAAKADERFLDVVARQQLKLSLGDMPHFGHWITPESARKRFDTHFYLCAAPEGLTPHSDGDETVDFEWVEPKAAVARAEAGEQTIIFPTLMNLRRLAESADVASAISATHTRPVFTVLPRVEKRPTGYAVVIPEEAGYGITEFAAPEVAGRPPE
jgi:8-oxo-dGTP pyrophosphatase MutT (NUDIX family)